MLMWRFLRTTRAHHIPLSAHKQPIPTYSPFYTQVVFIIWLWYYDGTSRKHLDQQGISECTLRIKLCSKQTHCACASLLWYACHEHDHDFFGAATPSWQTKQPCDDGVVNQQSRFGFSLYRPWATPSVARWLFNWKRWKQTRFFGREAIACALWYLHYGWFRHYAMERHYRIRFIPTAFIENWTGVIAVVTTLRSSLRSKEYKRAFT